MPRFRRLFRLCMYCLGYLGVSIPTRPGQTGISHGLCQHCLETHYQPRTNEQKD